MERKKHAKMMLQMYVIQHEERNIEEALAIDVHIYNEQGLFAGWYRNYDGDAIGGNGMMIPMQREVIPISDVKETLSFYEKNVHYSKVLLPGQGQFPGVPFQPYSNSENVKRLEQFIHSERSQLTEKQAQELEQIMKDLDNEILDYELF